MSEDKLDKIIEMMGSLDDSVTRLNTSVMGDEAAGVKGLAARVSDNEKKTEDALTGLRKFYTIGGTLSVIWGGLVTVVAIFKDHLFGKV